MDRVLERRAGLDVHKKTVTVCVRVPGASGDRAQQVRTFGTTTAELLTLREWLEAHRVTHVAMESTGVYWRPVFYVLEETFICTLANATQIAQVPGRKTDVNDAAWIAQLLECGLIRASFVPPPPISRRHARIEPRDQGFVVVDLGSKNGTYLDDGPVAESAIHDGDFLKLGPVIFRLTVGPTVDGNPPVGGSAPPASGGAPPPAAPAQASAGRH
jgi:hypothetical protein